MLRKVLIILLAVFISLPLASEVITNNISAQNDPDSLIPKSVSFLVKINKIQNAVKFINEKKNYFNINKLFPDLEKQILVFKEKTGTDLLDSKSLKDAGIDISRPLYLAAIDNAEKNYEALTFIPITDTKNFAINFIKLLKKSSLNPGNPELNPAISSYKNIRVFQVSGNIFFTVIDDYFVMARSGNILSAVIDLKVKDNDASLAADAVYKEYKNKSGVSTDSNIISFFAQKSLFEKDKKQLQENIESEVPAKKSNFGYMKYLTLDLNSETNEFSLISNLSVNKEDPIGNLLLQVITSGLTEKAQFAENPTGYHFLSLDLEKIKNYLDQAAAKGDVSVRQYEKFQNSEAGKNILKEIVLPCSKSFFNIIFTKSKNPGQMDNTVVFISMKECSEIEPTLKKIKEELKKRHNNDDTFGEEKINDVNSFWIKDNNGNRFNVLEYKGNLYAGNNTETLKNAMNVKDKFFPDIKNDFIKKADKNTFLISYTNLDDESFFKAALMMITFNQNPGLYTFISKIENITLIGKKIDTDINLNFTVKMQPINKHRTEK
jgi:hypothetical protein